MPNTCRVHVHNSAHNMLYAINQLCCCFFLPCALPFTSALAARTVQAAIQLPQSNSHQVSDILLHRAVSLPLAVICGTIMTHMHQASSCCAYNASHGQGRVQDVGS